MKFISKLAVTGIIFSIIVMAFVIAGPTIRGNQISFPDFGELINVENITLLNNSLILQDDSTKTISAIFNAKAGDLPATAMSMMAGNGSFFFPNTSTGFLGDVSNFDNINDFSRFSEQNINNGTEAAAGFQAINDVGFRVLFGIGSSNFESSNQSLSNTPSVISISPARFDFVNLFQEGWAWRVNQNNITEPRDIISVAELDESGNYNISGNFTGNQFYGYVKMFNESGVVIDLVSVGVFENITGINNGSELNGISYDGDHAFTIDVSGRYEAGASVSFAGASSTEYLFDFFVNDVRQFISAKRQITTANAEGSASIGPYPLSLNEGDIVTLRVSDGMTPVDPTIIFVQMGLSRIGI